jgi:hypothetical protein
MVGRGPAYSVVELMLMDGGVGTPRVHGDDGWHFQGVKKRGLVAVDPGFYWVVNKMFGSSPVRPRPEPKYDMPNEVQIDVPSTNPKCRFI